MLLLNLPEPKKINQSSFANIERFWINEVESYGEKDVELMLLGNKSDLESAREVEKNEVSVRDCNNLKK